MVGRAGGAGAIGSVPKTDARMRARAISAAVASAGGAPLSEGRTLAGDPICSDRPRRRGRFCLLTAAVALTAVKASEGLPLVLVLNIPLVGGSERQEPNLSSAELDLKLIAGFEV
jgi:hypothetical protein